MSNIVKSVVSIYRKGQEKPIERYKGRVSVSEENWKDGSDNFKKHLAYFLGLKEQASKFGLGSFDLKLYRLVKANGKALSEIVASVGQIEDLWCAGNSNEKREWIPIDLKQCSAC